MERDPSLSVAAGDWVVLALFLLPFLVVVVFGLGDLLDRVLPYPWKRFLRAMGRSPTSDLGILLALQRDEEEGNQPFDDDPYDSDADDSEDRDDRDRSSARRRSRR